MVRSLSHYIGAALLALAFDGCATVASAQSGGLTRASPDDPMLQSIPENERRNYVRTPGGLYYRYCMMEEGDVKLADGSIKFSDGTIRPAGPCPYPDFPIRIPTMDNPAR